MHCFCSQWITHCMILLQFRYSHIYIIVSVSPLSLLDFNEKWEKLFSGCFPALRSAFMHAKQRAIHNKSPSWHVANGLTRHDKHPLLYPTPHAALLPSLFCPDLPGYIIAEIPLDYLFIYGVVSSGGGGGVQPISSLTSSRLFIVKGVTPSFSPWLTQITTQLLPLPLTSYQNTSLVLLFPLFHILLWGIKHFALNSFCIVFVV